MQKFTADILYPVSSDPIVDGVIICDDNGIIEAIGNRAELSVDGAKHFKGALIPGFVNTHCHLELSHMKGLVDTGTGLLPFISSVVKFRDFPEEQIMEAIAQADLEMWSGGIMAVGDISNKLDTASVKEASKMDYYTFVEMFEFMQESLLQPTIEQYSAVYEGQSDHGKNKKSLVPHAPYSVGSELFKYINENNVSGSTVSLHNQETLAESLLFEQGTGGFYGFYSDFGMELPFKGNGKPSIHYAMEHMDPTQKTLFVHNTLTSLEDIRAALDWNPQVYWATCPNANLYIENRLPDYQIFMEAEAKMTIGTDSLTSNWQLSILEEIKTIAKYKSYVPFSSLLKWATLNGAEALSYDAHLGSLDIGKAPGILHLSAEFDNLDPDLKTADINRII